MNWWWNRLVLVVIAVSCFLVTAAGLRGLLPWPAEADLRGRVLTYLANRDAFDAVYLGSSVTVSGVNPLVVDPIISRRLGRPFASYNLGVLGALGLESDHLIRVLFDEPPERLRFVVIEASRNSGRMDLNASDAISRRFDYWHTPRATSLALADLVDGGSSLANRSPHVRHHLRMFARYLTNLGRVDSLVSSLDGSGRRIPAGWSDYLLETRGYKRMEVARGAPMPTLRRGFLDHLDGYAATVRESRTDEMVHRIEHYSATAMEDQVAFLESRGLIPIYIMPPIVHPPIVHPPIVYAALGFREYRRREIISNFVSYPSTTRHEDLFRAKNRWDVNHLNEKGAVLWSRKLGEDLAAIMAGESSRTDRGFDFEAHPQR
jgi:hypothetical protein